jgi:hypothetical protein
MATSEMRQYIVFLALTWGYDATDDKKRQKEIAEAACKAISYDFGFASPIKGTRFPVWHREIHDLVNGVSGKKCLNGRVEVSKMGPKLGTYTERIEANHEGYLHKTYRKAIKKVGPTGSWLEIAVAMNVISEKENEADGRKPVLEMNEDNARRWFNKSHGSLKKPVTRPILTDDRKSDRVEWCRRWIARLQEALRTGKKLYITFLDEKYFFGHSGRKKAKYLPLGPGEDPGADILPVIRTASRRFPDKVMFMAVIAKPQPEHGFDGKIKLLRVSRTDVSSKCATTELFSDVTAINEDIKRNWKTKIEQYFGYADMTAAEITDAVADCYNLPADIADKLVLRFRSFGGGASDTLKKVARDKKLSKQNIRAAPGEALRPLVLADMILKLQREKGDTIEKDVNCDSTFMAENMESIGQAIREAYHWVPEDEYIYLVMDNAGGHGTRDAIDAYVKLLYDKYFIIVEHQTPRSPEFNLCDLGFFNCFQSAVEKQHRGMRTHVDVIAKSVETTWEQMNSSALTKINERWERVLRIVEADDGDNRMVDSIRGQLFTAIFGAAIQVPESDEVDEDDDNADPGDWPEGV